MQDRKISVSLVRYKKYLDKVVSRDVNPDDKKDFDRICEAADTDVALNKLRELAMQGDLDAQYYLGVCYFYGVGVDRDKNKAVEFFVNAAVLDNPSAQNHLGYCLQRGEGIKKNVEHGLEWLLKAANQSNWAAHNNLGFAYAHGLGTQRDDKKGFEHTKLSADQRYGTAQMNLGFCYQAGRGTQKDEKEAFKCFQSAAAQNNFFGCELARCYRDGIATQKDLPKAFEWFHKSANANNHVAQCDLAFLYHDGVGTEKDAKKAVELYKKSADQNNETAQWNLAYCYDRGEGVDLSKATAFVWKAKSANLGCQLAMDSLTRYYAESEEKEIKNEIDKKCSMLSYHQQLAAQIPSVKGWALWGHRYLVVDGLPEIVFNFLIVSPHFQVNNLQDHVALRGYFLNCEFQQFKAELKGYAQSEHKSLSGYQARAQSFLDECHALTLSNLKHFNQWHESLQCVVNQFEAVDSKEAKNIPLHKTRIAPIRDNYYSICKRYLLFADEVSVVSLDQVSPLCHELKHVKS